MEKTLAREPEHGTVIEYITHRCRCPACERAWDRNADAFYASPFKRVPADAAREHLKALIDAGFEIAAISDAAVIVKDTIYGILDGAKYIRRQTSDCILAVDITKPVPKHRVPNAIVCRMLDEMRASGLTLVWIYKTAGVNKSFRAYWSGQRVSWPNYVRIKRVYDAWLRSGLVEVDYDGSPA